MPRRTLGLGAGTLGIVGALTGLACLEPPPLRPRDTGGRDAPPGPPALVVSGLEVRSFDGRSFPLEAAPRRPRLLLATSAPFTGEVPLYLLTGAPDESLRDDLEASPLRREHLDRAIAAELLLADGGLELVPEAPLEPGETYTVALGAWAEREGKRLGDGRTWTLSIGTGPELGARAVLAWPPDGAVDVGNEPAALLVAFDGGLAAIDGVELAGETGALDVERRRVDCAAYGLTGTCVALVPARALAPRAPHRLVAEVTDATGAPVPPFASRFLTGEGPDGDPPALVPLPCFADELDQDGICVRVGDADVSVRVRANEPVRATLIAGGRAAAALAPRGEVELGLPHEVVNDTLALEIRLDDPSGQQLGLSTSVRTPAPLPRLVITEVRVDPLGPEPAQEYVELLNECEAPIDLGAFVLADGLDREGDPLPGVIVPPGARVLVVADAFDPDDPTDTPPVPAGVPLVRIGTSLGEGGLSAAGELVVLRWLDDGQVHRVSWVPARRSPEAGACLVRIDGGFVYARDACSPGTE